jgi:hypothetical protein
MPYAEIAEIHGRKQEAVRQLARRARDHVQERRSRFEADQTAQRRVTERFLEATSSGDLEALMRVLAPEITLVADGGGRALAPRRPVRGQRRWPVSCSLSRRRSGRSGSCGPSGPNHPSMCAFTWRRSTADPVLWLPLGVGRSRCSFLRWPMAWYELYIWWPTPRS